MYWLHQQFYNFNVFSALFIVIFTSAISKYNMNKELKSISKELYENVEEIKDEIRFK